MADPWARLLYRRMSELSEEAYAAGWLLGNELMLWRVLDGTTTDYGGGPLPAEEIDELRVLAEKANGWIWTGTIAEHRPRLVSFADWAQIVADAAVED